MREGNTASDQELTDYWRSVLMGQDDGLKRAQRALSRMPAPPRCKLCQAPFSGPWTPLLRVLGFRRWELNQQLCTNCFKRVDAHQGGAEIPISLLFVDVRDSTGMAENAGPSEFTSRLNSFYGVVLKAVDAERGIVDHMAGDGVMAVWIPAFVGEDHSKHAIGAARRIVAGMDGELPVGIGVHTGTAYVGVVGHGGAKDFTALGDVPNTASRLSSRAQAGEVVISAAAAVEAGLDTTELTLKSLDLKGKSEPFSAWVETATGGKS